MRVRWVALLFMLGSCADLKRDVNEPARLRVGSKKFTESVLLGEVATQLAVSAGLPATHRRELGGTAILWKALLRGEIDVYPEYTGTLREELLREALKDPALSLAQALSARGIQMSEPLGFNNTYALGMKEAEAQRLGIRTLSDLRAHPELVLGFSNEFMERSDGWPAVRKRYALQAGRVRGLDHDLAYRALASGAIQVTDLYSTDAEIVHDGLRVLEDDLKHFPEYQAVWLWRAAWAQKHPREVAVLRQAEGLISASQMVEMNSQVKHQRRSERSVAQAYLASRLGTSLKSQEEAPFARILRHTREHLSLVSTSLFAAILVSVPLGVFAAYRPRAGQGVLALAGVIQTLPSLALLVLMIPLFGIGGTPAVVALFLYSLLPIIRNTATGLQQIPEELRESARALGLPPWNRLWRIELPLALPAILAGIKTSAVINVGTATLGALVGAGGYGQPILTGIRLDDTSLLLQGAIPAAVLALVVSGVFEALERLLLPRGLRLKSPR